MTQKKLGAKAEGKLQPPGKSYVRSAKEGIAIIRSHEEEILRDLWELRSALFQDVRDIRRRLDPDAATSQSLATIANVALSVSQSCIETASALHHIEILSDEVESPRH